MRRSLLVLLLALALCPSGVQADEKKAEEKPTKPLTTEQAADAALDAFETNDAPALKALAEKDNPDPWLVADELCFRGKYDAAEAFAKAAPRLGVERLPNFVNSRRGRSGDPARRERLTAANAALRSRNPTGALGVLGPAESGEVEDVVGTRLSTCRGIALGALGRTHESYLEHVAAAEAAERLGWLARAAQAFELAGSAAIRESAFATAAASWEKRLALCKRRGDRWGAARTLANLGRVYEFLKEYPKAQSFYKEALPAMAALGDARGMATTLCNLGTVYLSLGDNKRALASFERAHSAMEALRDEQEVARILFILGNVHYSLGEYATALSFHERALSAKEVLGDRTHVAKALGNIGGSHQKLGNYAQALSSYEKALAAYEALGDKAGAAGTRVNIGIVHSSMGDYAKALSIYERALPTQEALRDKAGVARTLTNMGIVYHALGDYAKALSFDERALAAHEALGDRATVSKTLNNIGHLYHSLGQYAKALSMFERSLAMDEALGDKAGVAATLGNLGAVYHSLGDYARSLALHERALSTMEALGIKAGAATTLANMANVYFSWGDYPKSIEFHERAHVAMSALGDKAGVARALGNLGAVYEALGDHSKALSFLERALSTKQELADEAGIAQTLTNIGSVHRSLGNYAEALSFHERALSISDELGNRAVAAAVLGNIGHVHLERGDPTKALPPARRAVAMLGSVVFGLGTEQGAGAREPLSAIYEVGARAALELGSASELCFFLESGRAGALLEGLNARQTLWSAAVPPGLRAEEARARAAEASAVSVLRKAQAKGELAAIRARRTDVEVAQEKVSAVIARIQREAKAGADLVQPSAATLQQIQRTLAAGEVLVLYGLLEQAACALVVTAEEARVVGLGESARIREAVSKLELSDPELDSQAALAALAALVVEPLGVAAKAKRVLVSPAGALGYVPFSALMPDATVSFVSSGTTYRFLREGQSPRGVGVLALGDPDYRTRVDAGALAVHRGVGARLAPLPATRDEIEAIGTTKLLGVRASEAGFRKALRQQVRWRAVHLACHGLVDAEHPARSSLALTPSSDEDGFLTALEVFRLNIPADLAVLSACETGRGKVVKTEGIVGLTRAFMFAGAPRVICSLWKVDDKATQALMVKFYELWNPKPEALSERSESKGDSKKGLGAAAALKKAQAYVRDFRDESGKQKWKHPYYWAAWVLWGLPE